MRVAVVSNKNVPGFPDRNVGDHLAWVKKAAGKGARLALFPELSLSGYSTADFMKNQGMTLSSPWHKRIADAAREHDIYVAFGFPLRRGKRLFISHVIMGPKGVVGHYEKVHLAGSVEGEGGIFTPGKQFRVFDVDGVKVGINICYDGRHPISSMCVSHLGAEIILHPHGNLVGGLGVNPIDWTKKKRAYLGARAIDTCTYTLICNSVGNVTDEAGARKSFSGGALVLDPKGRFVARSSSETRRPHMIIADLDIEHLRSLKPNRAITQGLRKVYVEALGRDFQE